MLRFISLGVLLAAYAVDVILAAPQAEPTSPSICQGYMWGVTIEKLGDFSGLVLYNQYLRTTQCRGPASVQSSTEPTPPTSFNLWGTIYECEVPESQYYCGETPVVTCCGRLG